MKTEITLKNKAKLFAQYWGQDCFFCGRPEQKEAYMVNQFREMIQKYPVISYLQRKPLSQITDEDAIEVAEIINISNYDFIESFEDSNTTAIKSIVTSKKDGDCYGGIVYIYKDGTIYWDYHNKDKYGESEIRLLMAYDFLRSKGYALPWMGLSVEGMVEAGWIKY